MTCIAVVGVFIAGYLLIPARYRMAREGSRVEAAATAHPEALGSPLTSSPGLPPAHPGWWPVQSQTLLDAFANSPANAGNRYEGKLLEVSGTICGISDEQDFITLNGSQPNPFRKVQCLFDKNQPLRALAIGQDISIRGRCTGLIVNVVLEDCVVAAR